MSKLLQRDHHQVATVGLRNKAALNGLISKPVFIFCLLLFTVLTACKQQNNTSNDVKQHPLKPVTVNGQQIDPQQLTAYLAKSKKLLPRNGVNQPKLPPDYFYRLAETDLVDQHLWHEYVKKKDLAVTAAELQTAVQEFREQFNSTEAFTRYEALLANQGKDLNQVINDRLLIEKAIAYPGINAVTEQEITAYYEQHIDRFNRPAVLYVREIVLGNTDQMSRQQANELAVTIMQQHASGKYTFADLAKRHSQSDSAHNGGLHHWTETALDQLTWQSLGQLAPDDVSEPLVIANQWRMVQLLASRPASRQSQAQAATKITQHLLTQRRSERLAQLRLELRSDAALSGTYNPSLKHTDNIKKLITEPPKVGFATDRNHHVPEPIPGLPVNNGGSGAAPIAKDTAHENL